MMGGTSGVMRMAMGGQQHKDKGSSRRAVQEKRTRCRPVMDAFEWKSVGRDLHRWAGCQHGNQ